MVASGTSSCGPSLFTLFTSDEGGSERNYRPELVAIQPQEISFARIHPVFCSSIVENDQRSIVNGFDQAIRPSRDDGEGSLWKIVAAGTGPPSKSGEPEQAIVRGINRQDGSRLFLGPRHS